jgi:multisubunit Na+/H+ antiporter MnhF subunit
MMKNLTLNRILWMLIGALSLTVAVFGVIDPAIYEGVVSPTIMPGVFTQDILVIITAVLLLILTATMGRSALRKQIVILRILGFAGLPGLFILGVGILSPLALAEVLKPVLFDTAGDPGGFWLYLILSGLFLILAVVYLYNLSLKR